MDPEQSIRKLTTQSTTGWCGHALEQAALARRGHQLRQAAAIDQALLLAPFPAHGCLHGEPVVQLARQSRNIGARQCDLPIELRPVLEPLLRAHQAGRRALAVVGRGEDAVPAVRGLQHPAAARRCAGKPLGRLPRHVHHQRKRGIRVAVAAGICLAGFLAGGSQQLANSGGDVQRVHRIRTLVGAVAPQPGQCGPDQRSDPGAGGLQQVLGVLGHGVTGDARAADLRHREQKDAARRVRQTAELKTPPTSAQSNGAGCGAHPADGRGTSASTRNCSSSSNTTRSTGSAGPSSACSEASLPVRRTAWASAAPRNTPRSADSGAGCRCGAYSGSTRRPRCSRRPR